MNSQKPSDTLVVHHEEDRKGKWRKLQCAECGTIHFGPALTAKTANLPWTITHCKSDRCQRETVHYQAP